MKVNDNFHVTKDGVLKKNPVRKVITTMRKAHVERVGYNPWSYDDLMMSVYRWVRTGKDEVERLRIKKMILVLSEARGEANFRSEASMFMDVHDVKPIDLRSIMLGK